MALTSHLSASFELPKKGASTEAIHLLRKEVIHPQLRLGIPCYDLVLIAEFGVGPKRGLKPPPTLLA